MISHLISVSAEEASGHIKLQTHKHTFTCNKYNRSNQPSQCRFEAPFTPMRSTVILVPMEEKDNADFKKYQEHYKYIRKNLADCDYENIDDFYKHNKINSDE